MPINNNKSFKVQKWRKPTPVLGLRHFGVHHKRCRPTSQKIFYCIIYDVRFSLKIEIDVSFVIKPMSNNTPTAILKTEDSRPATFGWLQLEKKVSQELQQLALKHPAAMATLVYLSSNMGRNNALAVSQAVIAKKVGVTLVSISRAIKVLEKHRFIEVVKVGNLCIYRVNTRVAWQGNRGEKYAFFSADVLAFETEQTTPIEEKPEPLKQVPVLYDGERVLVGNEPLDPPDQQEMELP